MEGMFVRKITVALFAAMLTVTTLGKETGKEGSDRWVVWSEKPAERWEHAFVTGNGRQGTMVLGNPDEERVICVHEELFIRAWDRNKTIVPVLSDLLPQIRQQIGAGQEKDAARLAVDEANRQLSEVGAMHRWPLIPHPAFDLCIDYKKGKGVDRYRRQLNLETGEAVTYWEIGKEKVEEHVFSSRIHNVNVVYLKAAAKNKLTTTLSLRETPGRSGMHFEHNLDSAFASIRTHAETDGWLSYHAKYAKDSGGYDGLARVTVKGGKMIQKGTSLYIENADEVLVVIRITPLSDGNSSVESSVKSELSKLSDNYMELLTPHSLEHGTLFRRMQLDLGAAAEWRETPTEKMLATIHQKGANSLFLEQVHAMGRYLLISSSGAYPPPLQGIWGGELETELDWWVCMGFEYKPGHFCCIDE